MMYLSWIAFYEGVSDNRYFGTLIPRILEDLIASHGERTSIVAPSALQPFAKVDRRPESIAMAICDLKEALDVVFVHGDTGGRAQEKKVDERTRPACDLAFERCEWPQSRCVVIAPRKEMEAWALADPKAVCDALGYSGAYDELSLPKNGTASEKLADPKKTLEEAIASARGKRRRGDDTEILTAIAQTQELRVLRETPSFQPFEAKIRETLTELEFIV